MVGILVGAVPLGLQVGSVRGRLEWKLSVGLAVGESVVHVLAEAARVAETFQTFETLEGLLAAVKALVLRQVVLVFERLPARVAYVRPLT